MIDLRPIIVIIMLGAGLVGCQTSGLMSETADYHSTRTPAQMDADEARIERVENKARQHEHEDQMANAEATEVATRHNPTSVSTSTTNVVPIIW